MQTRQKSSLKIDSLSYHFCNLCLLVFIVNPEVTGNEEEEMDIDLNAVVTQEEQQKKDEEIRQNTELEKQRVLVNYLKVRFI